MEHEERNMRIKVGLIPVDQTNKPRLDLCLMTVAIIVAEDDQGDRYSEDSFLRDGCLWWGGYGGAW